jgi:Tetratricopeptide repeat
VSGVVFYCRNSKKYLGPQLLFITYAFMCIRRQNSFALRLASLALVTNGLLWAEAGVLVVHVALLQKKGDYAEAEPLFRRALAIAENALGSSHPTTKRIKANLQALIDKEPASEAGK